MQRLYMSKSNGQIQQIRTDLLEAMDADIYEERERYIYEEKGGCCGTSFPCPSLAPIPSTIHQIL